MSAPVVGGARGDVILPRFQGSPIGRMELIRGWHNVRERHLGCVATIGNFDGVHRGHQVIVDQVAALGRRHALPATVVLFEPQPREFFDALAAPPRLMRLREKLDALARLPVDRVLLLRFDASLAGLEPREFIERMLVSGLGVRELVVGDDFRFGRDGAGDFRLLEQAARMNGFGLVRQDTVLVDGERVSSSRVRGALDAGNLTLAGELLGRPYALRGRVARGDALGRTIGYATANLPLGRLARPVSGVFAVRVGGLGAVALPGMANVGTRPTVNGTNRRLEVHLFDFDRDIYGHPIVVELVERLRDEVRFESLAALTDQLGRDAKAARAVLGVRA